MYKGDNYTIKVMEFNLQSLELEIIAMESNHT